MVAKTERGALSTSLLLLFGLFTAQFFVGMALNLLVVTPMTTFPNNSSSFGDAIVYVVTGGNLLLTSHFSIDIVIIAVGAVNLALVIHKSNIYKVLAITGYISALSAFVNGVRFVASNFTVNGISYGMAGGFILAFILYFVMAMLMYRDVAVKAKP
ncbi:MAG: hypothetical protein ABSD42_12640 [Candidatus Bathyarchaeia archaeon]